jgi:hypothetical protein
MTDVMLVNDAARPQRWRSQERDAFLATAFAPCALVSEAARQFWVSTGQVYTCGIRSGPGLMLRA